MARKYLRCEVSSDPGMFLGNTEVTQQQLHKCSCNEDVCFIARNVTAVVFFVSVCGCKTNVITSPVEFPALPTAMRST